MREKVIWLLAACIGAVMACGAAEFNRAPGCEESDGKGAFRLLVLGNSMALHGVAPHIGWTNRWGMAASAKEKDFTHLLWRTMEKKLGVAGDCRIHNSYEIERNFFDGFRPDKMYPADLAWKPDYVVIAVGENAPFDGRPEAEKRWEDVVVRMGEDFRRANPKARLVIRTPFWPDSAKRRAMLAAARRLGAAVADLGARGSDPAMRALDCGFAHAGVAAHPGDRGMKMMADTICAAIFDETPARIYALPESEVRCDLYRVAVDGRDVPVSAARVSAMPVNIRWPGHQREQDQTEIAGFVRFEMSRPVTLTVERTKAFKEVRIRPYSKNVSFAASDRLVTFTLEKPGDYSVEFDGHHENLHVFAQPPSDYRVKADAPNVRYFGPGVHDVGLIELKSGETLYIDEGAVVYGRVFARDADDIAILGRGILDMSRIREQPKPIDPKLAEEQRRKGFAITNAKRWDCIHLEFCDRVKIDGITMRDSLLYFIRPIGCRDLAIRNVKIIGSWRYNADGIDMHNCEHVRISDCFVRTYDDAICVKGFDYAMNEGAMLHDGYLHDVFKDVLIERCTFWNDWGLSLEFGAETRAREICDVTWRDCDVIRAHVAACDIQNCDYADIHDVVYDNIRLEFDGFYPKTVGSASAKDFDPTASGELPQAIRARIHVNSEYSKDGKRRGHVRNVVFRNIRVTAPRQPRVFLAGYDEDHRIKGVTIEGFFINGTDITDALSIDHEKFADAPILKHAADSEKTVSRIDMPASRWIARNDQEVPQDIPDYNALGHSSDAAMAFYKRITWRYWNRSSVRMRKDFSVREGLRRATLRGTGLGFYEAYLNGREVDPEHVLKPIKTTYQIRAAVRTRDVTAFLHPGANALGVEVAHGWFSPQPRFRDWHMQWQGIPCANFELRLEYADGSVETVGTDSSWRWSEGGVWDSCIYDGEKYDGRMLAPASDWASPGFDDSTWAAVQTVPPPTRALFEQHAPDNAVHRRIEPLRCWRSVGPERLTTEVKGYTFHASPYGTWLYDFGTNIAGRLRVTAGPKGAHLIIRHGEKLSPAEDRLDSASTAGGYSLDELRLVPGEEYAPRFTYHGFRYAEIEVLDGELPVRVVAEAIFADVERTGSFACGNALVNKIHGAVARTQACNLQLGVPVDCPQRVERLGWLGDAHVTCAEAWCNFGLADFYRDWLDGIAAQQAPSGDLPHVSPRAGVIGDVCWSSGYVFMMRECYRATGDRSFLERGCDAAAKYAAFLAQSAEADGTLKPSRYGDWYMLAQNRKDARWKSGMPFLTSSAYFHRVLMILAETAELLGREEAEGWREQAAKVRLAAERKWFDGEKASWGTGIEGVGANALALACGLVAEKDRARVIKTLADEVRAAGDCLPSGILGTQAFFSVAGEMDDPMSVWRILMREDVPSYAYMLRRQTNLCEEWEAEHGSFNHIMFGSVDVWLYEALAGLTVDFTRPDTPLLYRPRPVRACGWAKASRRLPDGGTFSVGWRYDEEGNIHHELSAPPGYRVRVILDGKDMGLKEGAVRW